MNPFLALVIANAIWGAASPVFKFALEGIPPFTLGFIRFFVASFIFLPWLLKNKKRIAFADWRDMVLGGVLGITVNVGFFFVGLELAPSINASIIGSLGPMFLYIFSLIILKEKPHSQILKGMLISLVGVLVIILAPTVLGSPMSETSTMTLGQVVGNIMFLIATIGGVFHTIFYKRVLKKVNVYVATYVGFLASAAAFFPLMLPELQTWSFSQLNSNGLIGILYGIFLSSAAAYFLYNYGVSKISAQESGVFNYISPIVAVLVAIPLVHEYPDMFFFIGAFLVFLGIYISEKHPHYKKMHKKLHKD